MENTEISLYTQSMKSNPLLYKYHRNQLDFLITMQKIHKNLSLYAKNYIENNHDLDFEATSHKLSFTVVKNFVRRLTKESNLKYRFYKQVLIVNYLSVIKVS
jgi:hypothetical protein